MRKRPALPDADEEGNDLIPPDPKSDVYQLIYLLEYGRKRGFQIGPTVQIGNVIVQVHDTKLMASPSQPEQDIYAQHGYVEKP